MDSAEEWRFKFAITSASLIASQVADDLMDSVAIPWAEDRRLWVGGSHGPACNRPVKWDRGWTFDILLGSQEEGRMVSRSLAHDLFLSLGSWCGERGLCLSGDFGAFVMEESGPA